MTSWSDRMITSQPRCFALEQQRSQHEHWDEGLRKQSKETYLDPSGAIARTNDRSKERIPSIGSTTLMHTLISRLS